MNTPATPTAAHVDAINDMFTQFQLAYHNQFHKAFANTEQLTMGKQLWLNNLCDLPAERIRAGTRHAIKESEYLPTIHTMRKFCTPTLADLGLPEPHRAYIEACRMPSPKAQQNWSHPAVYLAGNASDWFFLASNSESKAYPVFKRHYELLCERIINGEQLALPVHKAIPQHISTPLSKDERKQRMQAMRKKLNI